jgi:hypothetical protein
MTSLAVSTQANAQSTPPSTPVPLPSGRREFDPFVPPTDLTSVASIWPRSRVAVAGTVAEVSGADWVGGVVLEVTLEDATGSLVLTFFGRHSIGGIEPGRRLIAGGTIVRHRGRQLIMNPYVWLEPHS